MPRRAATTSTGRLTARSSTSGTPTSPRSIAPSTALRPAGLGVFGGAVAAGLPGIVLKNVAEEGAWRGYLTPALIGRQLPDPWVWLIVGMIWSLWHLPYYFWFLDEALLRSVLDVPPDHLHPHRSSRHDLLGPLVHRASDPQRQHLAGPHRALDREPQPAPQLERPDDCAGLGTAGLPDGGHHSQRHRPGGGPGVVGPPHRPAPPSASVILPAAGRGPARNSHLLRLCYHT